ncbi:GntR family transcriptional regulator [Chitinophaga pinensis]|uniref:Transcriptional regulator, GntR family n=1 Tax=Chitinophaga pinensis (strain ATCC 43595 / DSM 2588 / LMG 13176 / NBRC 15968 / NCIMB 11800 / UQM 2034) TaxID=485918 RepID=A0A979G3B0_CHIPD|nr:GntR family transcriptional regulator [Chitinophaga pinensis]ACU59911.1 transcriptional regulator, GntR family [Chitinophaga pinensis DSM 2588]
MMHLSIDHNSSVPLHIQAEELLRKMIEDPQFRNGKFLPNEVELSKELQISRTTLRQALNKLVYEGLLVRKKGIGTKVSEKTVSSKSMNWKSFSQEMAARGIPIRNFELHISWVKPQEELVHFFDIKPEQKVLKLERLRGRPEGPFVYFVSYFHPSIGLSGEEDFKRPLYEILEQDYKVTATLSKEEISAKAADNFIGAKLEIDAGSPILFRKRFVYDQDEHPIELNMGYYKSDSFIYTVESRR